MSIHLPKPNTTIKLLLCLTVGSILITLSACQEFDEPLDQLGEADISFTVRDFSGRGIPDVQVLGLPTPPLANPERRPARIEGQTDENGVFVARDLQLPLFGNSAFDFRLTRPEDPDFIWVIDSVSLPCKDTAIPFPVDIPRDVPCVGAKRDTILVEECLEDLEDPIIIRCTNSLRINCGEDVGLTPDFSSLLDIPGLAAIAVDPDTRDEITRVRAGESFCVQFTYDASNGPVNAERLISVNIQGQNPGSIVNATCELLLQISVSNCIDCECPNLPAVIQNQEIDSLCVGADREIVIDFGNVRHLSDPDCILEFTTTKPFSNPQVVQLLGAPQRIVGGELIPPLTLRFTPRAVGPFSDTLEFNVTRRNLASGELEDCDPITVVYNGLALQSECRLEIIGIPPDSNYVNTDSTFHICLGSGQEKRLRFTNTGDCEITLNSELLINAERFSVSPPSLRIPIGQFREFEINFAADDADVWPNGRGNLPGLTVHNGALQITGGGCDTTFQLMGDVDTTCQSILYVCLHEQGITDSYFESIRINDDQTLDYINDPENRLTFDIHAETIGANQVTLATGTDVEFIQIASNINVPSSSDICQTPLGDLLGPCLAGGNPGPITNLVVNDVVMFFVDGQCGLIYIQEIGPDRTDPDNLQKVCVQVCYPLVF